MSRSREDVSGAPTHRALFYRDSGRYLRSVLSFVRQGLSAGDAIFVAAPAVRSGLLRASLRSDSEAVRFVDVSKIARNPGCLIPAIDEFIQERPSGGVRCVAEPIWRGRNPAEISEATRYDSLMNLAFAGHNVQTLCTYDETGVPSQALRDARKSHPQMVENDGFEPSAGYLDPLEMCDPRGWPIDPPREGAVVSELGSRDLSSIRAFVAREASNRGLDPDRVDDVVLCVNEAATNSLMYGGDGANVRVWSEESEVICQVFDPGRITDPLVGLTAPGPNSDVKGLWLVNHLSDLTQIRSTSSGTTVRMRFAGSAGRPLAGSRVAGFGL